MEYINGSMIKMEMKIMNKNFEIDNYDTIGHN